MTCFIILETATVVEGECGVAVVLVVVVVVVGAGRWAEVASGTVKWGTVASSSGSLFHFQ